MECFYQRGRISQAEHGGHRISNKVLLCFGEASAWLPLSFGLGHCRLEWLEMASIKRPNSTLICEGDCQEAAYE